jgi:hypothetical protein
VRRSSTRDRSLHAEKARRYLRRQRPDLGDRLVPGADYRFGELIWVKPVLAVAGLRHRRRVSATRLQINTDQ